MKISSGGETGFLRKFGPTKISRYMVIFCGENFRGLLAGVAAKRYHAPNFIEETFTKIATNLEVFSLESFWLIQYFQLAQVDK